MDVVGDGEVEDTVKAWCDFNQEQLQEFYAEEDHERQVKLLASFMGVAYPGVSAAGAMIEYCYLNLMFCQEQGFTPEQTAVFHAIAKAVLEKGVVQGHLNMEQSFELFMRQMLRKAVGPQRGGSSGDDGDAGVVASPGTPLFSLQSVEKITDLVTKGLCRNFLMYRLCFLQEAQTRDELREVQVESPLFPPPLVSAIMSESG